MEWKLVIQITVSSLIVILGWFIVHYLNRKRDVAIKRRDLRLEYLLDSYRNLETAFKDPEQDESKVKIENSISDIQIFGNEKQAGLAREFSLNFVSGKVVSSNELINSLRDELRKELNLPEIDHPVQSLHIHTLKSG